MMKLTTAELIDAFREMTVLELSEFTVAFEGQFGVQVQAYPASQDAADIVADVPEEDEQTEFDVVLREVGSQKIQVIKAARSLTGLGLKEAKDLVESAPVTVLKGASAGAAATARAELELAGASVTVR
jgi:large subunit ribosomal protein L7/L12